MRFTKRFSGLAVLITFLAVGVLTFRSEAANLMLDSRELFQQIQLFADSVTLVSADYVEPIKAKDLVYGAIKGMMETLDGYSQFLDPDSFKDIQEETKGEFGGVGIEVGVRDGMLTVIAPLDDTPADKAGILPGDIIVKIEGEVTQGIILDDAVKKLRGTPGDIVNITVMREGTDEILEFALTRAVIKLKSIKDSKILDSDIGYIKVLEFQERTSKDLDREIKKLRDAGAKQLILDLRNNPGGLLEAAVRTSDLFFDKGQMIVYTEGREPSTKLEFAAKKRSEFNDLDLVVLVNQGSASAAEIFAGAIKETKRGRVIGETTFGKGSVQTVFPLRDNSALRITTAAYFTPSGKSLMNKGVDPDICVEKKSQEKIREKEKDGKPEKSDSWKNDVFILTAVQVLRGEHVSRKEQN